MVVLLFTPREGTISTIAKVVYKILNNFCVAMCIGQWKLWYSDSEILRWMVCEESSLGYQAGASSWSTHCTAVVQLW